MMAENIEAGLLDTGAASGMRIGNFYGSECTRNEVAAQALPPRNKRVSTAKRRHTPTTVHLRREMRDVLISGLSVAEGSLILNHWEVTFVRGLRTRLREGAETISGRQLATILAITARGDVRL